MNTDPRHGISILTPPCPPILVRVEPGGTKGCCPWKIGPRFVVCIAANDCRSSDRPGDGDIPQHRPLGARRRRASEIPTRHEGSIVDPFEPPRIRELLQQFPHDACNGDRRTDRLGSLDPGAQRTGRRTTSGLSAAGSGLAHHLPAGEIAQCDFWFPPITLPVDHGQSRPPTKLPVLTMTCGYSRWLSAVLVPLAAPRTCSRAGGS